MNLILEDYDYQRCYSSYTHRIMNLRQAKIKGEVILAKPVLLIALIEGVDQEVFQDNKFVLNEWLEDKYLELMKKYTLNSQFEKPADIANPFWHLASDGFWHLHSNELSSMKTTPSRKWLKENVSYASFDEDLWVLLMNMSWRIKFQNFISKNKLTNI